MNKLLQAVKQKFDYYYTDKFLSDNYEIQEESTSNNSFKYIFMKEFIERDELSGNLRNKLDTFVNDCLLRYDFQEWWRDNGNDYEVQHPNIDESDLLSCAYEDWIQSNQANGLWEQYEMDYHICNYIEIEFTADEFSSHVDVDLDVYYTTAYDNEKFDNESSSIMIQKDDLDNKMIMNISKFDWFKYLYKSGISEFPLNYFMDNYKVNRIAKKIIKGLKRK